MWQLVLELLPKNLDEDCTDILDDALPPPHNRHRNPRTHPILPTTRSRDAGAGRGDPQFLSALAAATATGSDDDDPQLMDNVPLGQSAVPGPSIDGATGRGVGRGGLVHGASAAGLATITEGVAGVSMASPGGGGSRRGGLTLTDGPANAGLSTLSDVNMKRRKVGMPELPDPNSRLETLRRVKSRRGALPANVQLKFYVPREELEEVLAEYQGAYGNVAEFDEEVRSDRLRKL